MSVVEEVRLIQVDVRDNHNKFYVVSLDSSGTLTKRWGRVGATGQTKVEPNSSRLDLRDAAEAKERRGYTRVETIDTPHSSATASAVTNTTALTNAAKASLVAKPHKTLDALIERIVAANKHAITLASGGQITFTATGQATTALGAISASSVAHARRILDDIVTLPATNACRASLVADYLTLVPQKVSAKRGWHETFATDADSQTKQYDLLDALVTVVPTAPAADSKAATPEVAFRYTVALADTATTKRIAAKFEAEKSPHHPSARLSVKKVYVLTDDAEHAAAFEKRAGEVRNRHEWFHGSRVQNVLNILRTGLYVPTTATGRTTTMDFHGAMMGPGAYFGRSTKAANYAYGGIWSGTRETGSIFVFVADILCGSEFRSTDPQWSKHGWRGSRTTKNAHGKAWDSIYVKGGTAGVINDERVIWDGDQIRLAFLVELA